MSTCCGTLQETKVCSAKLYIDWQVTATQHLKMAVCDETQTVGTQTLFDSVLNHAAILTETSTCSQLLLLSTVCQHQIVLGSAHFGMMRLSSKLTAMADFSSSDVSSAVICSLNNICVTAMLHYFILP